MHLCWRQSCAATRWFSAAVFCTDCSIAATCTVSATLRITATDREKLEGANAAHVMDVYVSWPHASGGRVAVFHRTRNTRKGSARNWRVGCTRPLCVCIIIGCCFLLGVVRRPLQRCQADLHSVTRVAHRCVLCVGRASTCIWLVSCRAYAVSRKAST